MKFISLIIVLFIFGYANAQYTSAIQLETLLKADTTSIGQQIEYPKTDKPEVTILKVIIPPGQQTGWHQHHFPVFAFVEQGTLTVETHDGKTLTFTEGNTFAEMINTPHNGSNNDRNDVILWVVYMGEKGKPLSEKVEKTN